MCPTRARALARAAALGLTLGACTPAAGPTPSQPETIVVPSAPAAAEDEPAGEALVATPPERGSADADAAEGKSCCKGLNECKGLGSCKTDLNDCAGKNDCKGKGGCAAHCPR